MKKAFLSALAFLFTMSAMAQTATVFNRISTGDAMGLASNQVKSIHQDKRGFIWVGTANGLQRFDGTKFVRFQNPRNTLPIAEVFGIAEDRQGRLWLSFDTRKEFGYFNPADLSYHKVPLKIRDKIPVRAEYNLWIDRKGEVYLNISRYGILHYNKAQDAFVDDAEFRMPRGWKPGPRVFEDTVTDRLYLLSFDSGVAVFDRRSHEVWTHRYNPKKLPVLSEWKYQQGINTYFIDSKRRHWIFHWPSWGGGPQFAQCFDSTGKPIQDTAGLTRPDIGYGEFHDIMETRDGRIWVNGLNVLFNSDPRTGKFTYHRSEAEHNYLVQYDVVNQVMEDRDGSVWVATDKGLFITNAAANRYISNLMFDESKGNSFITDILQLKNGDYWISNWGQGFIVLDRKFQQKQEQVYQTPPPAHWPQATKNATRAAWSLHQESRTGLIWMGFNGGILNVYDPVKGRSNWLLPAEFRQSTIRVIAEDKSGNLWFGTQGGILVKYENGGFRVMQEFGAIIGKVFVDKQNMVWVSAYEKGLYALDAATGKILQHYSEEDPKNPTFSNTANDVEQLNDSIIVYGAGALNFINKKTGKVNIYEFRDGLPSNTIQRLRMDKQGYLWIMTTSGLCRYNPANNKITPYGRKDGIIFSDLAQNCDYLCDEGYVMFGGENAIIFFDPTGLRVAKKDYNVMITDIKLFNEFLPLDSILQGQKAHFEHNQNSLSFYFSALSYLMNDKLTYYYKLQGADKDWVRAERNQYVSYSLLPPGQYEFQVYCEDSEGVPSDYITTFPFHVKPPFYKTTWFILLMIALVAGVVYMMLRMRVNKLISMQKLRLRVARDLHDDMGSTLSTINILSSMAKSKINSDVPKATEFLTKISENSQRMMEAMDDIVWSIKPSNDSMEKITSRMREFATNVLEAKDIEIDFRVAPKVNDVKLDMEARRDFFLIFKEAINNAAKYSKASRVHVFVTSHQGKLILLVHDNGTGFDTSDDSRGNGLGNMQKRADAMKGRLMIKSGDGEGTKITLTVPLT